LHEARGRILALGSEIRPACASIVTCTLPPVLRPCALAHGRCSWEGRPRARCYTYLLTMGNSCGTVDFIVISEYALEIELKIGHRISVRQFLRQHLLLYTTVRDVCASNTVPVSLSKALRNRAELVGVTCTARPVGWRAVHNLFLVEGWRRGARTTPACQTGALGCGSSSL
jgi:hypothetical protein